jgi:hypothetical protein
LEKHRKVAESPVFHKVALDYFGESYESAKVTKDSYGETCNAAGLCVAEVKVSASQFKERFWSHWVSLFLLSVKFTSPAARLLPLLVRVIELVESFQSLVGLG